MFCVTRASGPCERFARARGSCHNQTEPPMPSYEIPVASKPPKLKKKQIQLIANGDLRLTANQKCWPEQAKMESALKDVIRNFGYDLVRAHPYKEEQGHGFIQSQKEGMEVFRKIDPKAPIIVA